MYQEDQLFLSGGTPTEKFSEYLDFLLKSVMQDGWSYIKDTGDFLKKIKRLGNIPEGAILVTADVVGLYHNIPHGLGLQFLRKRLNKTCVCKVPTKEIISMAGFLLKNNYFEFNEKFKSKYHEQLLELNLHHLTLVFSWMKWKPIFLKHNNCSHSLGSDI